MRSTRNATNDAASRRREGRALSSAAVAVGVLALAAAALGAMALAGRRSISASLQDLGGRLDGIEGHLDALAGALSRRALDRRRIDALEEELARLDARLSELARAGRAAAAGDETPTGSGGENPAGAGGRGPQIIDADALLDGSNAWAIPKQCALNWDAARLVDFVRENGQGVIGIDLDDRRQLMEFSYIHQAYRAEVQLLGARARQLDFAIKRELEKEGRFQEGPRGTSFSPAVRRSPDELLVKSVEVDEPTDTVRQFVYSSAEFPELLAFEERYGQAFRRFLGEVERTFGVIPPGGEAPIFPDADPQAEQSEGAAAGVAMDPGAGPR